MEIQVNLVLNNYEVRSQSCQENKVRKYVAGRVTVQNRGIEVLSSCINMRSSSYKILLHNEIKIIFKRKYIP